jgi:hypothetical protein
MNFGTGSYRWDFLSNLPIRVGVVLIVLRYGQPGAVGGVV